VLRNAPDRAVGAPPSCKKVNPLRSRRFLAACAVALAVAFAPAITAATVYKWVDANGRIVYSDQPPPNVKTEVVRPPPPPANPDAAQELNEREEAERKQKKRKDEATVAERARADYERRREVCVNATGEQKALQQRIISSIYPAYRFNEKGERVIYTDQMRREDVERLQQVIRDNCPG